VFPGNDRPGIMLASAVCAPMPTASAAVPGQRAMRSSRHRASGWRSRVRSAAAGAESPRSSTPGRRFRPEVRKLPGNVPHFSARMSRHDRAIAADEHRSITDNRGKTRSSARIRLASPAAGTRASASPRISAARATGRRRKSAFLCNDTPGMQIAGAASGAMDARRGVGDGWAGRLAKVPRCSASACRRRSRIVATTKHPAGSRSGCSRDRAARPSSICRTTSPTPMSSSRARGLRSVEHLKRYTTLGMATDQGKTSNVNGLAIMAGETGKTIPETGTTIGRAAAYAGRDRRFRRPSSRQGFQADAADPEHAGPRAAGRRLRRSRAWMRAQWFRARRDRLAHDRHPRGEGCAERRRPLRRLDARQDRHPGRRCRRRSSIASTSTPSRRCPSARCATADAARGRFRHG
jgi:hypothetical protein